MRSQTVFFLNNRKVEIDMGLMKDSQTDKSLRTRQGIYFAKRTYEPEQLPVFREAKVRLPAPIFDEDPDYVKCYWKAWELAFKNFHEPAPGSGFVSQFIDAAFNQNIFLWDTCFMTMFCNYAHPYVPGICSLDNFYAKQHEDGEICREIERATGKDFHFWVNKEEETLFSRWGYDWRKELKKAKVTYKGRKPPKPNPKLTLDALNHPILAWAELESYRLTGDKDRLKLVSQPLDRYYRALRKFLRQGNGLYMTDSASMDNSTRNIWLKNGGTAIDISSEMVLFARNLSEMAIILGVNSQAEKYEEEANELSKLINQRMWDSGKGFYYDLTLDEARVPVKTIAGFWTLLAGVADDYRAKALVEELNDPKTFKTVHRVPTLAADQDGFQSETGGYWRGSVWAPTDMMVIRGLEKYGFNGLAREIALNHLENVVKVFKETQTIWENYAPQKIVQGTPAKPDFVGWSGIAPILFLIEYALGIKADTRNNTIVWDIRSPKRVGVERFWFGGKTVSLVCEEPDRDLERRITATSDGAVNLTLRVQDRTEYVKVPAGKTIEVSL